MYSAFKNLQNAVDVLARSSLGKLFKENKLKLTLKLQKNTGLIINQIILKFYSSKDFV